MRLELPEVLLNKSTAAKDIKVNAETLGRFRIKGIGVDGDKEQPFDIAVISTDFKLEGLSPSIKATGRFMDTNQSFTVKASLKLLTKDIKIRYESGGVSQTFNTHNILEFIDQFVKNVIMVN